MERGEAAWKAMDVGPNDAKVAVANTRAVEDFIATDVIAAWAMGGQAG